MTHIMLDLETLDIRPTAAIVAIGAVKFDSRGIQDRFYRAVDIESALAVGGTVHGKTLAWWLEQEDAARHALLKEPTNISVALSQFSCWVGDSLCRVWGNGAAFDNAVLANAFQAAGIPLPWKFWNDRCYRTLKNLYANVELERTGVKHNALHDAENQAVHLLRICSENNVELK